MRFGLPILLVFTALAYSGLWQAGFVWDDVPLIVQNHALGDASLVTLFTTDLWAASGAGEVASGYYRPMVLLSFALDRWVFGLEPSGYHLHSLCWHLVAIVGLHRLALPVLGKGPALLVATMFGLHPVQSEVVSWIAARNDLMAAALGFFALGVLWEDKRPSLRSSVCAALLTGMAALSKETALLLPLLMAVSDWARGHRVGFLARQVPMIVGVGFVLVLRAWVGVGEAVIPDQGGIQLLIGALPELTSGYAASVISPWPLSSARDLTWIGEQALWRSALGMVSIVVVGVAVKTMAPERRRAALLGACWAVVLIGITLVPTADKGGYGDRFLYWPMAGIALLFAALLHSYWRLLVPAFALTGAAILVIRLPDWKHDRALWGAAVRDVPTSTNEVSLGHALTRHARHKRAHVSFVSSLAKPGIDLEACGPVVGSAMRTGLPDLALRMGDWAMARGCIPTGSMNGWMAMAAARLGEWEQARLWSYGEPSDPRFRDLVVRAALARRDGNDSEYRAIASSWVGEGPLEPQVEALLTR